MDKEIINLQDTQLLTVPQVAALMSCTPSTVFRWVWNGTLPSVKLARRMRRIRARDLAMFIESRESRTAARKAA